MKKPRLKSAILREAEADGWKARFQANSIRVGFRLLLTKPMMEMLCACADGVKWNRSYGCSIVVPDNFLGTSAALADRGLIQDARPLGLYKPDGDCNTSHMCLTPAGKAVVELLKIGGLFIEQTEAKKRMASRRGRN